MRDISGRILGLLSLAVIFPLAVISPLALFGCLSPQRDRCSCTDFGSTTVTLPIEPPILIINAWTDPPCNATDDGVNKIVVSNVSTGTCEVHALLTNGQQYGFTVEFSEVDSGCCAGIARTVDASVPELFDAGTGSPD